MVSEGVCSGKSGSVPVSVGPIVERMDDGFPNLSSLSGEFAGKATVAPDPQQLHEHSAMVLRTSTYECI
jgi:hypothetical protein